MSEGVGQPRDDVGGGDSLETMLEGRLSLAQLLLGAGGRPRMPRMRAVTQLSVVFVQQRPFYPATG